jgi:hypothetical protein
MLIDNNPSVSAKKREVVAKLTPAILGHICKNIENKNVEIRSAVMNSIASLASTLKDELDKHIQQIIPLLKIASSEKDSIDLSLDGIKILSILYKSCKHGGGRNFINHATEMKDFLTSSLTSSSPKVVG